MKVRSKLDRFTIQLSLRGTKADFPWSIKPAIRSGLDIAPNPKFSPRFGESTRSRLVYLSMSSGAGRKETRMENILLLCRFGRAQGVGR
jgi:hypothetical protein